MSALPCGCGCEGAFQRTAKRYNDILYDNPVTRSIQAPNPIKRPKKVSTHYIKSCVIASVWET